MSKKVIAAILAGIIGAAAYLFPQYTPIIQQAGRQILDHIPDDQPAKESR